MLNIDLDEKNITDLLNTILGLFGFFISKPLSKKLFYQMKTMIHL